MKRTRSAAALKGRRRSSGNRPRPSSGISHALLPLYKSMDIKCAIKAVGATGVTSGGPYFDFFYPLVRGYNPQDEFIGNRITPVNLTMRWAFTFGDATNIQRVLVFQAIGTGAAPALANFVNSTINPLTSINRQPSIKFNCLADVFMCTHQYTSGATGNVKTGKIFVKGKRMIPIVYPSSSTTAISGAIYIAALSDSTIIPNPSFSYTAQLKYTDM